MHVTIDENDDKPMKCAMNDMWLLCYICM